MITIIITSVIVGIICGLLGSYAGAEGTSLAWRRIGIPVLLMLVALVALFSNSIFNLTILSFMLYSIGVGYGIPDNGYPVDIYADSGSAIGRFWWLKFNEDEFKANIATRTTVGLMKIISFLSIPLITGAWLIYGIFASLMIINRVVWGAIVPDEGGFVFFGKKLLIEEADIHFGDGFFMTLMILLSANTMI